VFRRRKQEALRLSVEQCMQAVVMRNPQAEVRTLPDGKLEVSVPYMKPWLIRLFSRKEKTFRRRFELDDLGSQLWEMFDGKHTVEQLVQHVADSRGLEREQAVQSMLAYLQMLLTRGLVGLIVPESAAPDEASE